MYERYDIVLVLREHVRIVEERRTSIGAILWVRLFNKFATEKGIKTRAKMRPCTSLVCTRKVAS